MDEPIINSPPQNTTIPLSPQGNLPYHIHNGIDSPQINYNDLIFPPTLLTNPMTTLGDLIYGGVSGALTRLAGNTTATRKFLRETGAASLATAPAWDTLVVGDIPNLAASIITSGTIDTARLGSGSASASNFLRGDQTWASIAAITAFQQKVGLAGFTNGTTSSTKISMTSCTAPNANLDSTHAAYVVFHCQDGSAGWHIVKLIIDSVTGTITGTTTVQPTYTPATATRPMITILGSYVYVTVVDSGTGAFKVYRYDEGTLANETAMTISGGTSTNANNCFPIWNDGTLLYIFDRIAGNARTYTVSGTTITFSANITYTGMGSGVGTGFQTWSDGISVWESFDSSMKKWALAGGSTTATSTAYNFAGQNALDTRTGAFGLSATIMAYLTFGFDMNNTGTASGNLYVTINPITRI